ncbi:Chaperonin 10 [Giardia duodenalis]|uniref:Chaperonin 10 n=1 Tax=Giardia intestinalis (strain ATCC 50803 / WB clone C6) TaxID=184922 RepID=A8B8M1_GIAIC|nr:Chaperonin 10 [Giardia intestinalis]KAE8302430.1 Chaperonin 10 [Giardia intestinalis]|eukprot:XP_001708639.1 Hypothetical protein GL50803_29500 [Giardia lamblia ATCC 50803]
MSLLVLGPRFLLERAVEAAGDVYTGAGGLQEYVVRRVGTGVGRNYESITEGDHVLVPASVGQELQIPGIQGLVLVDEEDVLIKTDREKCLLGGFSGTFTASSH